MGRQADGPPYVLLTTVGYGAEAHRLTLRAQYKRTASAKSMRLPAVHLKGVRGWRGGDLPHRVPIHRGRFGRRFGLFHHLGRRDLAAEVYLAFNTKFEDQGIVNGQRLQTLLG